MKIAISNIAWSYQDDAYIVKLLKKYAISGVEIAPTKIWSNPIMQSNEIVKQYRHFWEKNGITIAATQALLFGHPELTIFNDYDTRQKTRLYLEKMIRLSALLGAGAMVFGSPKNRDRKNVNKKEALEIASEFFYQLGQAAQKNNIFFCIEPNPKQYGTNFINNTTEAISLVSMVNHPNFRLHLDSGAMTVNKEDYQSAIKQGYPYLKHFHISEQDLLPVGELQTDHKKIAKILKNLDYDQWVSIEMRETGNQSNKKQVEKTLAFISKIYA